MFFFFQALKKRRKKRPKYFVDLTHSGVIVETLQYVPAPVPVFAVLGESVHVEQTLNGLRSQ